MELLVFEDGEDVDAEEEALEEVGGEGTIAEKGVDPDAAAPEYGGQEGVGSYAAKCVGEGVVAATHEVGDEHHRKVGDEGGPCRTHISLRDADKGHEPEIERKHHHKAYEGEVHTPLSAVGEFIPEGEIEEYSEAEFGYHHYGHHLQSAPI